MSISSLSSASISSTSSSSLVEAATTNPRKRKLSESSSDPIVTKFAVSDKETAAVKTASIASQTLSSSSAGSSSPKPTPMEIEDVSLQKPANPSSVNASSSSSFPSLPVELVQTAKESSKPAGAMSWEQYQSENPGLDHQDYDQYLVRIRTGYYKTEPFRSPNSASSSSSPSVKLEKEQEVSSSSSSSSLTAKGPLDWNQLFSLVEPSSPQPNPVSILEMLDQSGYQYFERFPRRSLQDLIEPHLISDLAKIVIGYVGTKFSLAEVLEAQQNMKREIGVEHVKTQGEIDRKFATLQSQIFPYWNAHQGAFNHDWSPAGQWQQKSVADGNFKYALNLKENPQLNRQIEELESDAQGYILIATHPFVEKFPSDFELDKFKFDLKSYEMIKDSYNNPRPAIQPGSASTPSNASENIFGLGDSDDKVQFPKKHHPQKQYSNGIILIANEILGKILGLWQAIHGRTINEENNSLYKELYEARTQAPDAFYNRWPNPNYERDAEGRNKFLSSRYAIKIQDHFPSLAFNIEQIGSLIVPALGKELIVRYYPTLKESRQLKRDIELSQQILAPQKKLERNKLELKQQEQQAIHSHNQTENQRVEKARKDDEAIPVIGPVVAAVKGWFGFYNPLPYKK